MAGSGHTRSRLSSEGTMPITLDTRALVTLEELKAHLEIPPEETSRDESLKLAINAATGSLEAVTGGPLVHLAITDDRYTGGRHDGRRPAGDPYVMSEFGGGVRDKQIFLRKYPVVSVERIRDESFVPVVVPPSDYYVRGKQGILEHFTAWPTPYKGDQVGEWMIDYTAGWFPSTVAVEWPAKAACLSVAADLLQRKGGALQAISSGSLSASFAMAAGVSGQARHLIGRYRIDRV
jgi:hypothetical protein